MEEEKIRYRFYIKMEFVFDFKIKIRPPFLSLFD